MSILGFLLWFWAMMVAGAAGTALWRSVRLARPGRAHSIPPARVRIVRPATGAAGWLAEGLRSGTLEGRDVRWVLTTASAQDPATRIAEATVHRFREEGRSSDLLVGRIPGPNRKVAQLAIAESDHGRGDAMVVADADVDLDRVDLDALLAELGRPGVGAVWSPVAEDSEATLGDRASAAVLSGSLHAFPLLCGIDQRGLVGKLFAVRAEALEAAGGFAALVQYLGEDMELARRLDEAGWTIRALPQGARSLARDRSLPEVIARHARWATVIRSQRPARLLAYPLLFGATTPLLLGAAALSLALPLPAALIAALTLLTRLSVAAVARRRAGLSIGPRPLLEAVGLAELVLWAAFLRALQGPEVTWAGRRLRVAAGGILQERS
ncbi:MAG: glycosyltransferase [Deltaproteobacteria bacterium]|nr:glycosyltransferase [Deltaproteobacteria bacterium]